MKSSITSFLFTFFVIVSLQAQSDISKTPTTQIKASVLVSNQLINGTLDNSNITALTEAVWTIDNNKGGTFRLEYKGSVDIYLYVKEGNELKQVNFFPVDGSPVNFQLLKGKNYIIKVFPSFGAHEIENYSLKLVEKS